jgi:aminopeptidase-like protein
MQNKTVSGTLKTRQDLDLIGRDIYQLIRDLYPICRSITGDGLRQTLQLLQKHIPLEIHEVPSGTQVFDWTVPKEWNIRGGFVRDPLGNKIVDFQHSNLQVVNYSVPIHQKMTLEELKPHLYSIPEHPDWIPYKTSYYKEDWGFCLPHRILQSLPDGEYEVFIDSTLEPGDLTYGELYLPGETDEEVLLSCHSCHPSLCNDNLSGVGLVTYLAIHLLNRDSLKYSYRFLFIPGTIGSITWLSRNQNLLSRIGHGLVAACVGDSGGLTYKKSRRGDTEIDRAVEHVLIHSGQPYEIQEFEPYGYDERQYCSPGFNLPIGCLSRTPYGRFPEYHTSADNLDFVKAEFLADSFFKYLAAIDILENNGTYRYTNPYCEPQLGKRGLYSSMGGKKDAKALEMAMLWVLNYSDGEHSLLAIAEKSGLEFTIVSEAAEILVQHDLLKIN